MLDISTVFNPNDFIGVWISSITQNFTGSLTITLVLIIFIALLLIGLWKLNDMMIIILLFPLIILFSRIDTTFNFFIGVAVLFIAVVIWSLFPGK